MLTRDLLRIKFKGKVVEPQYIDPTNPKMLTRATAVMEVFEAALAQHRTRAWLGDELREVEGTDPAHKLLKGLSKVLLDKCEFEADSPLPPAELRERVFKRAAETGPLAWSAGPLGQRTATEVWTELAEELSGGSVGEEGSAEPPRRWTTEELQDALYADLPDQQKLTRRTGPKTPEALLHRYNVALVQALLLHASTVTVRMRRPDSKRVRQLFRYLKFHQLMYRVSGSAAELAIHVDGPQSLLRQSSRYGLQLAIFFPAVLLQPGSWTLEAEVLWGKTRKLKKRLTIAHTRGLQSHYADRGAWRSNAEKWFVERFEQLDTGWTVHPGELLDLGRQKLMVPDLTFRRDGKVAHLDIVGFWRRSYLDKRLAQTPDHVVLAVSRRLLGDKDKVPGAMADQVVPFAEIIPAKKLLARIEAVAVKERPGRKS